MAEEVQSFKQVRSILDPLSVDNAIKAEAFDAYFDTPDETAFKQRMDKLNVPRETKAALWDLRFGGEQRKLKQTGELATPEYIGRTAVSELPAIGGAIGGATMGPAGAAAGGALGQAAKRALLYRKGETPAAQPGEFARDIALEGGKQLGYEVGGHALGKGIGLLRRAATPMYERALKFPSIEGLEGRELERALEERGEVAKRGLETRTPGSMKGAERADVRATATKPTVTREVASATQAGRTIRTADIFAPMDEQIKLWGALDPAEAKPLSMAKKRILENLQKKGQDQWMTPEEAQELKEILSKQLSSKAFRQGQPSASKITGKTAQYGGFKGEIEKAAPGVEEANRAIHLDLALKDAITKANLAKPGWLEHAVRDIAGATGLSMLGHRGLGEAWVVGNLIRNAVNQPRVMARLAILLDQAGVQLPKIAEPTIKYGVRFGAPLTQDMPPTRFSR